MPNGQELLYFLKIQSDIVEERIGAELSIKRVTANDWREWFGVEIGLNPNGSLANIRSVGLGPYANGPRIPEPNDVAGIRLFEMNYVIYGEGDNTRTHLEKIDQALRLFATGNSGISSGVSANRFEYFHPQAGWRNLSPSTINRADLQSLVTLGDLIERVEDDKTLLLIDRYRNATQGAEALKPHNRFVDLVTILEMIFVPDGNSGEISYKLRMRGACLLAEEIGEARAALVQKLKVLYNLRSRIVHDGEHGTVTDQTWIELCTYCRISILRYIRSSEDFTANALDARVVS